MSLHYMTCAVVKSFTTLHAVHHLHTVRTCKCGVHHFVQVRCAPLTVIRLIFVVKIFSYAENIRNYFTLNFCYNEYFSNEYLEQSTCAYAVHAVFVALRILEGYGWTHVYPSVLKADRQSARSERIALHHHSICRYSIC